MFTVTNFTAMLKAFMLREWMCVELEPAVPVVPVFGLIVTSEPAATFTDPDALPSE